MAKRLQEELVNSLTYMKGEQPGQIFLALPLKDEEKSDYRKVIEAFNKYFVVRINVIYERAIFNTRIQHEGEFITSLNTLARNCKLQCEADLTLEKAIDTVRTHESLRRQQIELSQGSQMMDSTISKFDIRREAQKKVQREKFEKCGGWNYRRIGCTTRGKRRYKCNRICNFARVCRGTKTLNNIESVEESDIETLYLGVVENGRTKDRWCELIKKLMES